MDLIKELKEYSRMYDTVMYLRDSEIMDDDECLHYKGVILDDLMKIIRREIKE